MRPARFRPLALVGLALGLASCDVGPVEETFTFDVENVRYDFEIAGDDLEGAVLVDVESEEAQSLLDEITTRGFGLADVRSVRLVPGSAQIRLLVGGDEIDVLDEARVALRANAATVEVASQDDFSGATMAGEADLDVASTDLTDLVAEGDMDALLRVRATTAPAATYRFEVRFDVRVEVEGI